MDTKTKAVRDGAETRHDPQTFIAAFLDGARLLTPDPNFVVVENPGYAPDNGAYPYLGCETPTAIAILTEMLTGVSAAPSAAGGAERPGDLVLMPRATLEEALSGLASFTGDATGETQKRLREALAPSPSQGSDTGEAGREPGAYGIPGMPDQCSLSDQLRAFAAYHAAKLPDGGVDDLCRLADEWDEEVEAARRPAQSPTVPQGADLAGLSAADINPGIDASDGRPVTVDYINYRGERGERRILPNRIVHGATEYHPRHQWLLEAVDLDKGAMRVFALEDMRFLDGDHPGSVAPTSGERGQAGDTGTEWFWRIVDADGLGDVPSDEEAALRLICRRAAAYQEASSERDFQLMLARVVSRHGKGLPLNETMAQARSLLTRKGNLSVLRDEPASPPTATQDPDHTGGEER